jgi:glycosyltransferase involved in cell wall biosynthesis
VHNTGKSSRTNQNKVTVIIAALNEEKNLPFVLPKMPSVVDEILLVDGNSTDNTVTIAKELRPDIRVLYQEGKGKGDALRYGFKHASGDIIVTLDADGSMDPEEIPRFVDPLLDGHNYVKGSRFIKGGGSDDMPASRIFGNKVFVFLVNLLYGGRYTDLCYGYTAFSRHVFDGVEITSDGFEIETELNIKALKTNLRITEVPSYEAARLSGQGYLRSFRDGWRILKTIFQQRFSSNGRH